MINRPDEGLSPAERFAAALDRADHPQLATFAASRPFRLDDFQFDACRAVEDGRGVLVCAPTGAGKTLVGEFAVHRALAIGGKCFYTTPIKALSNQKYADLCAELGNDRVGLLTGDTSVNSHAPVVVMTTEVLRNMLYAQSADLAGLTAVVLDEIHYLADKFRGAVWEEVILHLLPAVQVIGLSATVSNAEEFGAWLQEVRGNTTVVVDEIRPVPLWQHMMVGRRMYDLFAGAGGSGEGSVVRIDPALTRAVADAEATADRFAETRGRGRFRGGPRWRPPARVDVIERLDGAGLLPAITFIFSRAGCDAAVAQCVRSGMRLTTDEERAKIRAVVNRRTAELPESDLAVLGYWEWREALERGVAAHHAGLLPVFKETVEELFVTGLVKAVFATETLALGINMPARTVVLEKLTKFNGDGHVDLTPGEYTQLTGRAGRRGIDIEGHAVVIWAPGMDPRTVGGLASRRTYPLHSSFRPSYNMAVNLVEQIGRSAAGRLLEQSFAQFQSDRSIVGVARQVKRNEDAMASLAESMSCERGDVGEYLAIITDLSVAEKAVAGTGAARRRAVTAGDLAALRRGDVVSVPTGRRAGLAVVIEPGADADGGPRPLVITAGHWAGRLTVADFRGPVPALGRLRLAKTVEYRSAKVRKDIAAALRSSGIAAQGRRSGTVGGEDAQLAGLRAAVRGHPVHRCPDRDTHLQWARRRARLRVENQSLTATVSSARGSLVAQLDAILALLTERGYVDADMVTPTGRLLGRIWSESDLVVAECLHSGTWDGLSAPDLASVVSVLVFESRRDTGGPTHGPAGPAGEAIDETVRIWAAITAQERAHHLPTTRGPDLAFAVPVGCWARGESLATSLAAAAAGGADLSAGDFVRWCRQVIDLLDQIGSTPAGPTARTAKDAVRALRRGVVAMGTT